MNKLYLGLDVAETMGVALYNPREHHAYVTQFRGTPHDQLQYISNVLGTIQVFHDEEVVVVFEQQHNFRNAMTTRALLERQGFLKWTMISVGFVIKEVSPDVARKLLGTRTKRGTLEFFLPFFKGDNLTDDHTDALAVAVYQAHLDGDKPDYTQLLIERPSL